MSKEESIKELLPTVNKSIRDIAKASGFTEGEVEQALNLMGAKRVNGTWLIPDPSGSGEEEHAISTTGAELQVGSLDWKVFHAQRRDLEDYSRYADLLPETVVDRFVQDVLVRHLGWNGARELARKVAYIERHKEEPGLDALFYPLERRVMEYERDSFGEAAFNRACFIWTLYVPQENE